MAWKNPLLRGRRVERRAARHLRSLGFLIVERNVRIGGGEIDIVAVENDCVIFCEVRDRAGGFEEAFFSVGRKKREVLRHSVRAYRSRENLWGIPARGDLVCSSGKRLDLVRDAFSVE